MSDEFKMVAKLNPCRLSECILLGIMMNNHGLIATIREVVSDSHFWNPFAREVFWAIRHTADLGLQVDEYSVYRTLATVGVCNMETIDEDVYEAIEFMTIIGHTREYDWKEWASCVTARPRDYRRNGGGL